MCFSCICLYVLLIFFFHFSLSLGIGGWLRLVIVALPGLFYELFQTAMRKGIYARMLSQAFV